MHNYIISFFISYVNYFLYSILNKITDRYSTISYIISTGQKNLTYPHNEDIIFLYKCRV